jgi:uncharacterized Zn-binding protein involved in type VI secretion
MGEPAAVMGDRITGQCVHMIPGPSGGPVPSPPLPFSAPLTDGLATDVLIEGKPAVVAGSSGLNAPPHVGLHGTDPFLAAPSQRGKVVSASLTVSIGGKPAAKSGAACTCCLVAGQLMGSAVSVLIGG